MAEIQRLGHALVDRAEALLSAVRADMKGQLGIRIADDVLGLVQAADAFHDGLNLDSRADDVTRNGFAGVAANASVVANDIDSNDTSKRIQAAWQSYRAADSLMRQALKLPAAPGDQSTTLLPSNARTPTLALADRLVSQVDEFLIAFTPEAGQVTEGGNFIVDARRLRAAAADFREIIPRAIDVGQLAYAFRDVDALWARLRAGPTGSRRAAKDPTSCASRPSAAPWASFTGCSACPATPR